MVIKQIDWIGHKEAIVTISDGRFEIIAFAHPFNGNINDKFSEPLLCLSCDEIKKANKAEFKVIKLNNSFEQYICAELIDKENNNVKVGKIKMELDSNLPKDIKNKKFLTFKCGRIDILS